jgi:hypothetical protein
MVLSASRAWPQKKRKTGRVPRGWRAMFIPGGPFGLMFRAGFDAMHLSGMLLVHFNDLKSDLPERLTSSPPSWTSRSIPKNEKAFFDITASTE